MRVQATTGSEEGFTLVEVAVAALVLVVGVLAVVTLAQVAIRMGNVTKARDGANALAREALEDARSVPYPDLSAATLTSTLQNQGGLVDDSAAAGWQVKRNNVVYTLAPSVCTYDDGRDGGGVHDGTYCSDSTPAGTADVNPDDYRRVQLDLSWTLGGRSYAIRQTALINNPGSAFAPSVKTLSLTTPSPPGPTSASPAYVCTNSATAGFSATTNYKPTSMVWSVEGVPDEDPSHQTGSASTTPGWTWSTPFSGSGALVDGPYVVTAQAVNDGGTSGTQRAMTVVLNRSAPPAPAGFVAGHNDALNLDEFEWTLDRERDITGYRVYKSVNGTLVTPPVADVDARTSSATASEDNGVNVSYVVRAYAVGRSPCSASAPYEESASSTPVSMVANVAPPSPPSALQATTDGTTVSLTWSTPVPPPLLGVAGEPSDTLRYYRVYRDGRLLANRIGHTGGAGAGDLSFVDSEPGPGTHTYYVTAVDSHLAEGPAASVGPL